MLRDHLNSLYSPCLGSTSSRPMCSCPSPCLTGRPAADLGHGGSASPRGFLSTGGFRWDTTEVARLRAPGPSCARPSSPDAPAFRASSLLASALKLHFSWDVFLPDLSWIPVLCAVLHCSLWSWHLTYLSSISWRERLYTSPPAISAVRGRFASYYLHLPDEDPGPAVWWDCPHGLAAHLGRAGIGEQASNGRDETLCLLWGSGSCQ